MLRKATPDDISAVAELYDKAIDHEESHVKYTSWQKGIYPTADTARLGLKNDSLYVYEEDGLKIAILNYTYGTNGIPLPSDMPYAVALLEEEKVVSDLKKAEELADFTIVCPHWGTEYQLRHSTSQENTARMLVESGADAVIGSHPHVIQDYQEIDGVPVAYSLGNAVSNMSAANTQLELMATIRIVRQENGDLTALPLELDYLWCSRPGGFREEYTVIPVKDYIGRPEEWHGRYDYDKMKSTYDRVRKVTE
jgi:poly-gamma-glutamate synthesis protein (capsule biosynthesis protein)